MRVLLIGNYKADGQESMIRFADLLHKGALERGYEVRLISASERISPPAKAKKLAKWVGYLNKFILFLPELRRAARWADLVHVCDHSNSIYLWFLQHKPNLITCHDLLAVRSALGEEQMGRTGRSGKLLQGGILRALRKAQHVVCVSEATRRDVARLSGVAQEHISMIYNGLAFPFTPMVPEHAAARLRKINVDPGKPFILSVGGNQWYKNRLGVLRIFDELRRLHGYKDVHLIMVGKPWNEEMREFITSHRLESVVLERTNVCNETLQALYSMATLLLFPSFQEGFGWPIIEAQSCGCPVAVSNRPPMNEIGGSAAIYFAPECITEAASSIAGAASREKLLREQGIMNASRFNTSRMLDAYSSLYKQQSYQAAPAFSPRSRNTTTSRSLAKR